MQSTSGTSEPDKPSRQLVISVDISATTSAVSFAHIHNCTPSIHRVSHWPVQRSDKRSSIVPSVILYDADGVAIYYGAEVYDENLRVKDELGLSLIRNFKLRVDPAITDPADVSQRLLGCKSIQIRDIPIKDVYIDFMTYLLRNTREHIIAFHHDIWDTRPSIILIIPHPSSWWAPHQRFLREVAIQAAANASFPSPLLDRDIKFIYDADAALHFCLNKPSLKTRIESLPKFVVCDAGGSTTEIAVYSMAEATINRCDVECWTAGGEDINEKFIQHLCLILRLDNVPAQQLHRFADRGILDFEDNVKPHVDTFGPPFYTIQVADDSSVEAGTKIREGAIAVSRNEMLVLFKDACISRIQDMLESRISAHGFQPIVLVGGVGHSPLLKTVLEGFNGYPVICDNEPLDKRSKEVVEGALQWYSNHRVNHHVVQSSFGLSVWYPYKNGSPEHNGRAVKIGSSGKGFVTGKWHQILAKGRQLRANEAISVPMIRKYGSANSPLGEFKVTLFSTQAERPYPWVLDNKGYIQPDFRKYCDIYADLSQLGGALEHKRNFRRSGFLPINHYWTLAYNLVIEFGHAELKAFIECKSKRITTIILYDQSVYSEDEANAVHPVPDPSASRIPLEKMLKK